MSEFGEWPCFTEDEIQAVADVLRSNKVNYWTGNRGREFQRAYAEWVGVEHAVAVCNGTVALEACLRALQIGGGDEVIVTPRTFIASISCIIAVEATPVFADVDPRSQNISAETVAPLITNKTKAIICVHLAGWPCEMDALVDLVAGRGVYLVEDCAQAHGAKYKGRSVGGLGDAAAWSFCQDKIMSTGGEGGMVTSNSEEVWEGTWTYKDHGKSYDAVYNQEHSPGFRWLHSSFGTNWRITEMQAVIGLLQLEKMADWHQARNANAGQLIEACGSSSALDTPLADDHIQHAYYKFYSFIKPGGLKASWSRDRVVHEIQQQGVPCFHGSCSEVYLEQAFKSTGLVPTEPLTVCRHLGETSIMMLVHPTLTEKNISDSCEAVRTVLKRAER